LFVVFVCFCFLFFDTGAARNRHLFCLAACAGFVFAVIYYDYDSQRNRSAYDYFGFSVDRLSVYDDFVKFEI